RVDALARGAALAEEPRERAQRLGVGRREGAKRAPVADRLVRVRQLLLVEQGELAVQLAAVVALGAGEPGLEQRRDGVEPAQPAQQRLERRARLVALRIDL